MVECNGTVVEQSVPYEANGTMIFCLQNDPVIRPLGIPGHFIKGEICGNVCDTTTSTSSSSTTTTSTTVECPDCYWYDLYCDGQVGESSVFDMVECNGTVVEQSVPYEANGTMIFCLQNDPVIRPLGIPGHFIKGEICGNVCDTTTSTSSSSTTTTSTTVECPDCYWYDLYSDEESQSAVFDMVECNGTIVEQSVPYEDNPMTFCLQSDPINRQPGVVGHFVKGETCGNTCDTTTTSTTAP